MIEAKSDTRHFDQKMINLCTNIQEVITEKAGDNTLLQTVDHRLFRKSPKTSPGKNVINHIHTTDHRDITVTITSLLKSLTLSPSKKGESE